MIGRNSRGPRASRRKACIDKLTAACAPVAQYQSGQTWELLESRLLLSATVLRVDSTSTAATPDGSTWANAFPDLQAALSEASSLAPSSTSPVTIEVAQGTYKPAATDDPNQSFQLLDDTSILGGFAGLQGHASISPDTRDATLFPTILSGNLIVPQGGFDHSHNVVTASDVDDTAVLDGFIVTGGGTPNYSGGALSLVFASPTINDCTFTGNNSDSGGAVYAYSSSPTFSNCDFLANTSQNDGGVMYVYASNITLENCAFENNVSLSEGGAIFAESSPIEMTSCTFTGNTSEQGGAIWEDDAAISATNSTFTDNSATTTFGGTTFGGAVVLEFTPTIVAAGSFSNSSPSGFTNCLFAGNTASTGGAVYTDYFTGSFTNDTFTANTAAQNGGAMTNYYGSQTLTSDIIYGDGGGEISEPSTSSSPTILVRYSDVQGGYSGTGNINADPKFANPAAGEYELTAGSPAIGAGQGGVDVGAFPFNAASPVPAQADLIPENVTPASGSASFDSTIGLTYTDQNIGTAAAGANWVDAVYLSDSPTLDANSVPLAFTGVPGQSLSSGAGINESLNVTLPQASGKLQGGTYYFVVQTDVGNTVGESNLANNIAVSGSVSISITPKTIFVDQNSPATSPDGTTWAMAYPDLQTALAQSEYGDTIEVAQGNYEPTSGTDSTATFTLKDGVALQGGFAGAEGAADHVASGTYNYSAYVTTLSGDIAGDGHSYSVVTAIDSDDNTVIEGFTITGAAGGRQGGGLNASYSQISINNCTFEGDSSYSGGAISFNESSSSSINNSTFTGDNANYGGAIYSSESSLIVSDSTFTANSTSASDQFGRGGAIEDTGSSDSSFFGCTFSYNSANEGGAIFNSSSFPTLTNCLIYQNTVTSQGGGIYDSDSSPSLINCLFTNNGNATSSNSTGATEGGAIFNTDFSSPTITNCTFSVNGASGTVSGAIYDADSNSTPNIGNSILWNDAGGEIAGPGIANVSYSDVQGNYGGDGNISLDPKFNNAVFADYSLTVSSPAIDAGSNALVPSNVTTDLNGNPRIVDVPGINDTGGVANVDMGAYEYQPAANFVPLTLPDLQPQNVVPSSYSANFGQTISISWTDSNTGTVPTSDAGWTDSIYLSTTNQVNQNSILLGTQAVTGPLAAGKSISLDNVSVTLPQATRALDNGTYFLVIETNSGGTIQEFSVQNNVQATGKSLTITHTPQTLYVDASSPALPGNQVGTSWAKAFSDLQSALAIALDGDTILVAQGKYVPTMTDDPSASFQLLEDVTLLGGYGGQTAVLAGGDADTRNVSAYTTTLSGNISSQGGNAYSFSIVTASDVDSSAVLDGFTITGATAGQAMDITGGSPTINDCTFTSNGEQFGDEGGALSLNGSSATISNCTFNQNIAEDGGAVFINGGSPQFSDCLFIGNSAYYDGGAVYEGDATSIFAGCTFTSNQVTYEGGGAVYSDECTLSFTGCTFTTNSVTGVTPDAGGALSEFYSNGTITDCAFFGNTDMGGDGGAIYNYDSSPAMVNCLFSSNAAEDGAAVYDTDFSSPTITNNTFSGNTASDTGGAVYDDYSSAPVIANSILYGDGPDEIGNPGTATVSYSDVQGAYSGTGNINADPLLVRNPNPATQDFGDLHLQAGSPVINAGSYSAVTGIMTDLDGNPRSANGEVDMGAYEYSATSALLPDLEPQDVSTGVTSADFGGAVTVSWTDANIGNAAAAGPWTDDIFLSPTPTLGSGAVLLDSVTTPSAGLAAGESEDLSATVNLPGINTALSDGTYYILVKTDANNAVVESNGNNNVVASGALSLTKTITWINTTGGDWNNPANWSTGTVPGAGDDAVIDVPNIAITISTNVTVDSLRCQANLTVSGSLTITGGAATGVPTGSSTIPTSDLALWLEANQGVTTSSGDNVTAWNDQSGNGNNATPGSGTDPILVNNAIGTEPALQFSGSQFLDLANQVLTSQQYTIFAVVTDTGALGNENFREIFSNWSPNNTVTSVFLGTDTNGPQTTRDARFTDSIGGADQGQVGVGAVPSNQAFILSGLSGSEDASVGLDGATMYDLGSPIPTRDLTTGYAIGAQGQNPFENWQGDIAEVLVYNTALSASDIAAVNDYLAAKYSVPVATVSASTISGSFTVDPGASLAVSGSETTFTATGSTTIDGANITAASGAQISLPQATSYTTGSNGNGATLKAGGAGSVLSLPNVTAINGDTYNFFGPSPLFITASAGGTIDLPAVQSLASGNYSISVTGAGSEIDLPALTTLDSANGESGLSVTSNGNFNAPSLTSVTGFAFTLDSTSVIATSQITTFTGSSATLSGGTLDFNSATDIDGSSFVANGGATILVPLATSYSAGGSTTSIFEANGAGSTVSLADLTTLNGSTYNFFGPGTFTVEATAGGTVKLPALTTLSAGNFTFTISGASSVVDLPALTSISSGNGESVINVTTAGEFDAPSLTSINGFSVSLDATGVMPLSQVVTFTNSGATITGGTMDFSAATDIDGSSFVAQGGGTLSIPIATSYSAGGASSLTFEATGTGSSLSLLDLATLNGSIYNFFGPGTLNVNAFLGGVISLPAVQSLSTGNFTFNVTGANSQIHLPNLAQFTSGNGESVITVNTSGELEVPLLTAITGVAVTLDGTAKMNVSQIVTFISSVATITSGMLELAAATDIDGSSFEAENGATLLVPNAASYSAGNVNGLTFQATGANSLVSFPALTTLNGSTYNFFGAGSLNLIASAGGTINLPAVQTLADGNYSITVTGANSLLNIPELTTFTTNNGVSPVAITVGGKVNAPLVTTVNAVALTLDATGELNSTQVATFTNSSATVTGATLDFNAATDIDGSSFFAQGGATISIPLPTSYSAGATNGLTLEATGTGSTLSLPALTTLNGSTYNFFGAGTFYLTAAAGGTIDLPAVQALADGNYTISSTGTGSVIDLPLVSVLNCNNGQSSVTAATGGTLVTANSLDLTNVHFTLSPTGILNFTTLTLESGTLLDGTGSLSGQVTNIAGTVSPGLSGAFGAISITGVYAQDSTAALSISLGGTTPDTTYDQLQVSGAATIAGTLNLALGNSFFPAFGQTFNVVTSGLLTGNFTTINGNSLGQNTELDPTYTSTAVELTANQIVGPFVTASSITSSVTSPLPFIDLTFSKEINPSTFTTSEVTLIGPNGPVPIDYISEVSPTIFQINFTAPLGAGGNYSLSVGPDIQDFAGNEMDQNMNGKSGESGDAYVQTFTISLPDLAPTITSTTPPAEAFGAMVNVSWTDTNLGNAPATGGWVDDVYLSTTPTLGGVTRLLASEPVANQPVGPGGTVSFAESILLPAADAGLAPGTYYILIDTDANNSVGEAITANNVAPTTAINVSEPPLPDLGTSNVTAQTAANPGSQVTVDWTLSNSGSAPATGPWNENIYIATDAQGDNPTLVGSFVFTGTVAAGSSLPRSATITLPSSALGNVWFVVSENTLGQVFETDLANNTAVAASPTNVSAGLTFTLTNGTVSDSAGSNATTGTISRNGDLSSSLLVTISDPNTTAVTAPMTVTIPAGQASVTFPVSAVLSNLVGPTQSVTLTASASGLASATATLQVTDANVATLTVTTSISTIDENAANPAGMGTVTTNAPSNFPTVVTLVSNTTGKLTVPATVTIPAGQTSVSFPLTVIDDMQVDGDANVTITATSPGYVNAQALVDVVDVHVPTLTLSLAAPSIPQNGGSMATTGTITFSQPAIAPFQILLNSSNIGAATVPSMLLVQPGQTSISFPIAAVDNGSAVNQSVTISALIVTIQGGYLNTTKTSTQLTVVTVNGPDLSITFPVVAISADGTTTATVTRNTDTTNPLTVTLASSDTTHASVPLTVTIPAGQSSATFTVTGVDDMKADGEQFAQISASATGFAEGLATIGVTTVDLPDLTVSSVTAPTSAFAGTQAQISWTVQNTGMYATVGTWSDEIFLDPIGGAPSTTPIDTVAYTGNPLAAGRSYAQSDTVTLPTTTGAYVVRIVTDPGQTVQELSFNNNSGAAAAPLDINAPYHATVTTSITAPVPNGTAIPLSGHATYVGSDLPATNVQVAIGIMVNGTARTLLVNTDSNGNYSTFFQPLQYEGGSYSVSADYPGVTNSPAQAFFTIVGMSASPSVGGTVRVVPNTPLTGSFTLTNLTNMALTGLTATAEDAPSDFNIQLSVPQMLPGSGQVTFSYSITADGSQGAQSAAFLLEVTTAQGAFVAIPINVVVTPITPQLSANPGFLSAGMLVGSQTMVQFVVTNDGGAPTGPLQVVLPSAATYLSSTTPTSLPSLAPGQSTTISLLLTPDASLALGQYTGSLAVNYAGGGLTVPFTFKAISGQTGNVQVTVDDYYTFNSPGMPRVANANVSLLDPYDNSIVIASGTTDSTGVVTLTNVPAGPYVIQVTAVGHNPYNANYTVTPGITNTDEILLPNNLVTYSWIVVPTEIQDQYSIKLQTTYVTNVPAPVVTITAPSAVPTLPPGGSTQIEITLTNHGLIAANNVVLNLPVDPEYTFTALTTQLGTLPAQSSVTVPVIVTYNPLSVSGASATLAGSSVTPVDGGGGGSCTDIVEAAYNFICDDQTEDLSAAATMSVSGRACDANEIIAGFGGGGGGGLVFGGGPGASVVTNFNCVKCLQAAGDLALNTLIGAIPGVGPILKVINDPPKTPGDVIITIGGFIPGPIGEIFGLIGDANDINNLLNACFGSDGGAAGGASAASASQILADDQMIGDTEVTETEALNADIGADSTAAQTVINYYSYFFGSTDWLATTTQTATEQEWLQDFVADTQHTTDGSINSADQAQLLATDLPSTVSQTDAQEFLSRWNLTVSYNDQGITTAAQVPAGDSTDFIDSSVIGSNAAALNNAIIASQADGFTDPVNQLQSSISQLLTDAENPAVCASVVLQIDQTATLTRQAFAGTLQINNNEGSPLTNIQVALNITDANGNPANGEFFIETPTLSGSLTAIDGTGALAADSSGGAAFTFIPVNGAANNGPTTYFIGGTITYLDPAGGAVSQTIYPTAITVYPQPNLIIDYFLQRDVVGEDPSDPSANIPSEPAVLGMLVTNTGAGEATNLSITTAQPQIVENEKGLLDTFQIIGTQVGDQQVTPSLTVDLGDIASGQTADADFLLTSSLQGIFTNFSATFTHSNALGGLSTSLISSINTYDLVHAGDFNFPGSTGDVDYLVDENPNFNNTPDTIFFSNGTTSPVTVAVNPQSTQVMPLTYQVTASVTSGWDYIQLPDPGAGETLYKVVRSDGTVIPVSDMAWTTDRTFSPDGKSTVDYELHIIDDNSTGSYTVYYKPVTTVTPALVSLTPISSPQSGAIDSVDVTFNEAINAATFSLADATLTLNGGPNLFTGGATLTQESPSVFTIGNLTGLTAGDGNYVLTVNAAGVQDLFGDVASGSLSETWATGTNIPVVVSVGAGQPSLRNTPVSSVDVVLSEPIVPSSFTTSALILTLNGGSNLINSGVTITQISPNGYEIDGLTSLTQAVGTYVLTVSAGSLVDASGNTGVGFASEIWTLDQTPPTILSLGPTPQSPRNIIVPIVDVTFSKPIDPASFTYQAITFSNDGGPNLILPTISITQLSPTEFQVTDFENLMIPIDGAYTFTVNAADVTDLAGNTGVGTMSESWVLITAPPTAPTNLAITPDTGVSSTDGITDASSVTFSGSVNEPDLTVQVFDNNVLLGDATVTGETFSLPVTLLAGTNDLTVDAFDAAANVSPTSSFTAYYDNIAPVLTVTQAPPAVNATPLDSIDISFSEPVSVTDLSQGLSLSRNGGPNLITGAVTITPLGNNAYEISGLSAYDTADGNYTLGINNADVSDVAGNPGVGTTNVNFMLTIPATVVGQDIFYFDTYYDGFATKPGIADNGAIATDKTALLPGQTATFANYTSYSNGINGIIVDIANLPGSALVAGDFNFLVGDNNDPTTWTAAPAPVSITVLPGDGANGSTRIELVFANGAIRDEWLQVTVAADSDTGLTSPYVFYFGNAVGSTGHSSTSADVNVFDALGVRSHESSGPVSITDPYDINKDGSVNAADLQIVQANETAGVGALQLISVPAQAAPISYSAIGESTLQATVATAPVVYTALADGSITAIDATISAPEQAVVAASVDATAAVVTASTPVLSDDSTTAASPVDSILLTAPADATNPGAPAAPVTPEPTAVAPVTAPAAPSVMALAAPGRFFARKWHSTGKHAMGGAAVKSKSPTPPATFIPAAPASIADDVLVGAWNALAQSPQSPLFSDIMLDSTQSVLD